MSAQHEHPPGTGHWPSPAFLVDGCPRCAEYVEMIGRPFDSERFREFWAKMVEVEWDDIGHYHSKFDAALGRKLYLVSLQFEAAFGLHPRELATFRERFERLVAAIPE
jgi:hypothetical protein